MKLAVFSDAHGRGERMAKVVKDLKGVDYLLYAGDVVGDLKEVQSRKGDFKVLAVRGNCDFNSTYSEELVFEVGGKVILLTHGHKYNIKYGIDRLYYRAKEVEADIVIFGHTHCRYAQKEDGVIFFNPGSISLPRDGWPPSYGVIEINNEGIKYKHCDF